jgi:hypothetical protein
MDDARVAGNNFCGLHPPVRRERRRKGHVDVAVWRMRLNGEGLGHRQDVVRLPHLPPRHARGRRWQIRRVASLCALIDPGRNRLDLSAAQAPLVREVPVGGIGVPRWHGSSLHPLANGFRPWPHVLVRQDRKWRHVPRAMTRRAVLKYDRRNIPAEGDVVLAGIHRTGAARGHGQAEARPQQEQQENRKLPRGQAPRRILAGDLLLDGLGLLLH